MAEKKPPASTAQETLMRNLRLAWNCDLTVWGDEPETPQSDAASAEDQDYSGSLPDWMETGPIYEITVW